MAFESWQKMYLDWLDCLAGRKSQDWFLMSYENSREMRTTYTKLDNISEFTEWLKVKADEEKLGAESGTIFMAVGGN